MCVVSAIYDYGYRVPEKWWNRERYEQYKHLIEHARQFDEKTGQPHCEDEHKADFLQKIMDRLDAIERKIDAKTGGEGGGHDAPI